MMLGQRILIIGSSGAGKSTLARQLGERLGLPVIHLDAHHWRAGWVAPPTDEWRETVARLTAGERWIMDGNYSGTFDIRLPAADTTIFLDFPRVLCLWRVLTRWLTHRGRTRPDMAPGCPEMIDGEFLKWIWVDFPRHTRPDVLRQLAELAAEKQVFILRSPRELASMFATIPAGERAAQRERTGDPANTK